MQLVEVADHLAVRGEVLGRHRPDRVAHPADELVEDLLAEPLDELVEPLARVGLEEVVLAQVADPLADVARQGVELVEPLRGDVAEHLLEVRGRVGVAEVAASACGPASGRACRARPLQPALDARPLLRHDLLELAPDVAEDVAQLEPLAQLLAPASEPVHQVLQAGQVRPGRVAAAPAALHEPPQRLGQVALGHDVVRELVQDLVGVEVGDLLAAVPARVPGAPGEGRERVVGFSASWHVRPGAVVRAWRAARRPWRPARSPEPPPRSRGSGVYQVTSDVMTAPRVIGGRRPRPRRAPC